MGNRQSNRHCGIGPVPSGARGALLTVAAALLVATPAARAGSNTIVTLTFDDGFADQAVVPSMLAARGMHATFFVNSAHLGTPGYLTVGQVLALQAAGHEVGG